MFKKVQLISSFSLVAGFLFSLALNGQTTRSVWDSYDFLQESTPWLQTNNAAGLYSFSLNSLSDANVYLKKGNGKFVNYFQSDNSIEYGGGAKSLYRISPRTVFFGEVQYVLFEGKNMGGSSFINPYRNPFDIVEFADTTRGEKSLESYLLKGAFSIGLARGLHVGAGIEYKTSNFAKFKDLRHENIEMDMALNLGSTVVIWPFLEAGVNYTYQRRVEEVRFQSYGNTDQSFNSLINFGAFYGYQELFSTGSDYAPQNSQIPLFEQFHGASLQINATIAPNLELFNELSYRWRDGYYGKKGTSSKVYTEHDSKMGGYKGVLSLKRENSFHKLSFGFQKENLLNFESFFRNSTLPDGTSVTEYFGRSERLNKKMRSVNGGYTAFIGMKDNMPEWTVNVIAGADMMNQQVTFYPKFRKQKIDQWRTGVYAGRNIIGQVSGYSINLGLCYLWGNGDPQNDGSYDSSAQNQQKLVSLDRYIYREFEFLTAKRVSGNIGFRYSRNISGVGRIYSQLDYAVTKAFSIRYIGKTANDVSVSLGIGF